MEQLVVDNRKLVVNGIEGNSEYKRLVRELMLAEYTRDYTYSTLVQQSKSDLKGYAKDGVKDEFLCLPNLAKLVEERKNEIASLGYSIPNVETKVLERVDESIKKEYGEDAKAVAYPGITSKRLKEVKFSLNKAKDFKAWIFQDKNPVHVVKILKGESIM